MVLIAVVGVLVAKNLCPHRARQDQDLSIHR